MKAQNDASLRIIVICNCNCILQVLVVELERTSSKAGAKLGVIYVPASEVVGFQDKTQYSVDQKIAQLSHTSQVRDAVQTDPQCSCMQ